MGETAKAMIERFRNQKPLSREQRQELRGNHDMKEMWWVNDNERNSQPKTADDIEFPRPSPMKPHHYPSASVQNSRASGRDFPATRSFRDSDDDFLSRFGQLHSNQSLDGSKNQKVLSSPKFSHEFESGVGKRHRTHQPTIDDLISEDVKFSGSIDRLLNAYPKYSVDTSRDGGGVRPRSSMIKASERIGDSYSFDPHDSGTLKGLLLSLKLDGVKSSLPAKEAGETGDQKNMSENLQAIIDSLACLDETNEKGQKGPGVIADSIKQVYNDLHSDMTSFTSIYGEKYANEDEAAELRKARDDEMRQQGRREQLKDLELEYFQGRGASGSFPNSKFETEEVKKGDMVPGTSTTSAVTAISESRLRAAWLGMESRPVWSTKLGRYVNQTDQSIEGKNIQQVVLNEEKDNTVITTNTFQPLFSSPTETPLALPPTPGYDLSHDRITGAARSAIETCLNATERTLLIRLPSGMESKVESDVSILEQAYDNRDSNTESETPKYETSVADIANKEDDEDKPLAEETRKPNSGAHIIDLEKADGKKPPKAKNGLDTIPLNTAVELEKLDEILGHDDEILQRYATFSKEQKLESPSLTHPPFRSVEDIDRILSSKPSLPPDPTYRHSLFEPRRNVANLKVNFFQQAETNLASSPHVAHNNTHRQHDTAEVPPFFMNPESTSYEENNYRSLKSNQTLCRSCAELRKPQRCGSSTHENLKVCSDEINANIYDKKSAEINSSENTASNFHERTKFLNRMKNLRKDMMIY